MTIPLDSKRFGEYCEEAFPRKALMNNSVLKVFQELTQFLSVFPTEVKRIRHKS